MTTPQEQRPSIDVVIPCLNEVKVLRASVETTLRYQRCILPAEALSPLDRTEPATQTPDSPPADIPEPRSPVPSRETHLPLPVSRTNRLRDWLARLRNSTAA